MKKLVCLCAFSTLLLTSCSSGSDSSTTTESDVLVTKTVENYALDGSTVTTNYTYNGKKLVKSTDSDGYHKDYTYTGDLITKIETIDDSNATLMQEQTFTYNASGQLVTYIIKDFDSGEGDRETYVYNSDGTISTAAYSGNLTTQTNSVSTGVVHFTIGEVTSVNNIETLGGTTSTTTYTYGTKNHPFKNITGYDKISFIDSDAAGITHNVLTQSYTSGSQTDVTTTTYTYNALNFPMTGSEIEGTDATTVIATTYTYN